MSTYGQNVALLLIEKFVSFQISKNYSSGNKYILFIYTHWHAHKLLLYVYTCMYVCICVCIHFQKADPQLFQIQPTSLPYTMLLFSCLKTHFCFIYNGETSITYLNINYILPCKFFFHFSYK